jgi:hypothetical protein
LDSAHRTVQIVVIFLWDVVQPVPSTCKLYSQVIYWDAIAFNEFDFRLLELTFSDVAEELTLVQSV